MPGTRTRSVKRLTLKKKKGIYNDVTIVTACDDHYVDILRETYPNWQKYKKVDTFPVIVFVHGIPLDSPRLDFLKLPNVRLIEWSKENDLDDVDNGTTYSKVLTTDIDAGHIKLTECTGTIDSIDDGTTYGRVALTDISAGHILLAECVGNIDGIADGDTYGKVLVTDVINIHIKLNYIASETG